MTWLDRVPEGFAATKDRTVKWIELADSGEYFVRGALHLHPGIQILLQFLPVR